MTFRTADDLVFQRSVMVRGIVWSVSFEKFTKASWYFYISFICPKFNTTLCFYTATLLSWSKSPTCFLLLTYMANDATLTFWLFNSSIGRGKWRACNGRRHLFHTLDRYLFHNINSDTVHTCFKHYPSPGFRRSSGLRSVAFTRPKTTRLWRFIF